MGANAKSFRSVAGNKFARKLWFARLRASGLYRDKCKAGKGKCRNLTAGYSKSLKTNEYANVSPRDGNKYKELKKKGSENAKKGIFKSDKAAQAQQVAMATNIRQEQQKRVASGEKKLRGARFKQSASKVDARIVDKATGKETKVRSTAAVGTGEKREKAIKKEVVKVPAQDTAKKLLDKRGRRKKSKALAEIKRTFEAGDAFVQGPRFGSKLTQARKEALAKGESVPTPVGGPKRKAVAKGKVEAKKVQKPTGKKSKKKK